jgi:hypothetical protein
MGTIIGLVTDEGLSKSQIAQLNAGWKIYPREFAFSESAGTFSTSRTYSSLNPTWYRAAISAVNILGPSSLELICTIPPGMTVATKNVAEMYILAKDNNDVDFLLALGQPQGAVTYDPAGSSKFRFIVTIANLNLSSLYVFNYTQASEIEDHNIDPNAHQDIRNLITGGGYTYRITGDYNSDPGRVLLADTTTGPLTVYLPSAGLSLGSFVEIQDVGRVVETAGHELYIDRNGNTIEGVADNFQIDKNGGKVRFTWDSTALTWIVDIGGRLLY